VGHFWPYSAWEACVNGVLTSKLDVHINIGVIIVNIYILGYTGVGEGQWPSEWGGPASGELLYNLSAGSAGAHLTGQQLRLLDLPNTYPIIIVGDFIAICKKVGMGLCAPPRFPVLAPQKLRAGLSNVHR